MESRRDSGIIINTGEYFVEHLQTRLIWTKNGNTGGKPLQFFEAIDWVKCLSYGGYSDWRLPTKEELEVFVKVGGTRPSEWFNANDFNNVRASHYWSSCENGMGRAWCVNMVNGQTASVSQSGGYVSYVWPVRSIR